LGTAVGTGDGDGVGVAVGTGVSVGSGVALFVGVAVGGKSVALTKGIIVDVGVTADPAQPDTK